MKSIFRAVRAPIVGLAATAPLIFFPSSALAYRPFDGTDADVAEHGSFELEMGPAHYYLQGGRSYALAPATVLNFGILDETELVIDFQNEMTADPLPGESRDKLIDTDILIKRVLRKGVLQEESGPSIALEVGPLLPEVNGTRAFGASADCIVSFNTPVFAVHFNEWLEYTREHNPYVFSGAILEGPGEWVVRPVAELFYSHEWSVGDEASGLVGALWTVRESFVLDLGVRGARIPIGSGEEQNALEVRFGFTWALPVWGKAENAAKEARMSANPRRG